MKNNYCLYLLLLLFFFGCNKKNEFDTPIKFSEDSLSSYLSKANDFSLSIEKRNQSNGKAFSIIANQKNSSSNAENLFKVANRYYNMDKLGNYKKTIDVILERSIANGDTISKTKAYSYLGDFYVSQAVSDSAFLYYSKAEKLYLQRNDIYNLARTRLNKAILQFNEGDFIGSEIAVFSALRAIKKEKSSDVLYIAYNHLALIHNELKDYNRAIEYNLKALASIDNKLIPSIFQSRAESLNNMGYVYQNMNRHDKALIYFKDALQQQNLKTDKSGLYAMVIDNLAYSKFKIGDFYGLPEEFYESLKLRDSLQLSSGIIASKMHLSEYFAFKKDHSKSLQYAKEALNESLTSKNYRSVLLALKRLSIIDPQKSPFYTKEYIRINDSLQVTERKMGDKFTRIEYETDQIKSENTDLLVQNRNLVYFFTLFGFLGLLIFIIKSQKAKNRLLLFKQQQQNANEEIYNLMISQQNTIESSRIEEKKRVARELHDGVLGRMFGVRMNLDGLNAYQDDTAIKERTNYLAELKNIEQDIREISHDLNREKSELINNFVAIIDKLFEEQKKTYKAKFVSFIDSDIKWESVSNAVKINLYRILQESLQNSNKYAAADEIKVEFKKVGKQIVFKIIDDGIGFNVKTAKKGIGIQNIIFRTNECKGIFEIESKKGKGTIITVTLPTE